MMFVYPFLLKLIIQKMQLRLRGEILVTAYIHLWGYIAYTFMFRNEPVQLIWLTHLNT